MGCDIHPAIEVFEYGRWTLRAIPKDSRFYEFFGALAGVRGTGAIEPVAPGRGIPENVDPATRKVALSGDHSGSWCTLSELKASRDVFAEKGETWGGHNHVLGYLTDWIDAGEQAARQSACSPSDDEVRFVFDFDS